MKQNEMNYEKLEIEIIPFDTEDVIRASLIDDDGETGSQDRFDPIGGLVDM